MWICPLRLLMLHTGEIALCSISSVQVRATFENFLHCRNRKFHPKRPQTKSTGELAAGTTSSSPRQMVWTESFESFLLLSQYRLYNWCWSQQISPRLRFCPSWTVKPILVQLQLKAPAWLGTDCSSPHWRRKLMATWCYVSVLSGDQLH